MSYNPQYGMPPVDPNNPMATPGTPTPQSPWFMQQGPQQPGAGPTMAAAMQQAQQGAPVGTGGAQPDLASQMAAANAVQAAIANPNNPTLPNRKPTGLLPPGMSKDYITGMRGMQQANALRNYGAQLNTGSERGGAPNWAGALANVFSNYAANKLDKTGQDALSQYFQNAQQNTAGGQ
jgi:hypothetical protein